MVVLAVAVAVAVAAEAVVTTQAPRPRATVHLLSEAVDLVVVVVVAVEAALVVALLPLRTGLPQLADPSEVGRRPLRMEPHPLEDLRLAVEEASVEVAKEAAVSEAEHPLVPTDLRLLVAVAVAVVDLLDLLRHLTGLHLPVVDHLGHPLLPTDPRRLVLPPHRMDLRLLVLPRRRMDLPRQVVDLSEVAVVVSFYLFFIHDFILSNAFQFNTK